MTFNIIAYHHQHRSNVHFFRPNELTKHYISVAITCIYNSDADDMKKQNLTALADLTVLSLHLRVRGVTPRHRRGVRVTTVVII